jgi:hypothetical protein
VTDCVHTSHLSVQPVTCIVSLVTIICRTCCVEAQQLRNSLPLLNYCPLTSPRSFLSVFCACIVGVLCIVVSVLFVTRSADLPHRQAAFRRKVVRYPVRELDAVLLNSV